MKKIFAVLICLIVVFGLIGCGAKPSVRTYTLEINVTGQSIPKTTVYTANKLHSKAVIKDPDWWVDRAENEYFSCIVRGSDGNLDGSVEAHAILRDDLGNTVAPINTNDIVWSSPDNPVWSATGLTANYCSSTQNRYVLRVDFNGDIYTDVNTGDMTPIHLTLSAEAVVILVYSNSEFPGQTDYFNMTNIQCVSGPIGAEIYHTNEGGVDYINAPFGMALILDQEIDPLTNEINWFILGSVKKIPDGLTFTDTKLPLTNYGTYIVRLSGGGYAKVQAHMGSSIMWFLYSTSPDNQFSIHYGTI